MSIFFVNSHEIPVMLQSSHSTPNETTETTEDNRSMTKYS